MSGRGVAAQKLLPISNMPLSTNLTAYWTFDDVADLLFPNSVSINVLIPATEPTLVTGKIGGGYALPSANNQWADAASIVKVRPGWGGSWYASFWAVGTASDNHAFLFIGTNSQFEARVIKSDASMVFQVNSTGPTVTADGVFSANDSTWHFIEIWFDADNYKIGIRADNGTPVEISCSAIGSISGSVFRVGDEFPSGGSAGEIRIDELGIWRRKLSTTESNQLWNSGAGLRPF